MERWAAVVLSIVLATSVARAAETPTAKARPAHGRRPTLRDAGAVTPTPRRAPASARALLGDAPLERASVLVAAAPFLRRAGGWVYVGKRTLDGGDDDVTSKPEARPVSLARLGGQFPGFTPFGGEDVFGRVVIPLFPRLTLWTEYHALRLIQPSDLWYALDGSRRLLPDAFSGTPLDDARPRAQLLELGLSISLPERLSANLHYGRRLEGTGASAGDPAANYGYVELTIHY
jgi:hypothetical protein